jgi:hypothetical protein
MLLSAVSFLYVAFRLWQSGVPAVTFPFNSSVNMDIRILAAVSALLDFSIGCIKPAMDHGRCYEFVDATCSLVKASQRSGRSSDMVSPGTPWTFVALQ